MSDQEFCTRCGEDQPLGEDGLCDICDGSPCEGCGKRAEYLNDDMMCAECEPPEGVCDECGNTAKVFQVGPHAGLCELCAERAEIGEVCENCQGEGPLDDEGLCAQCARERKRGKADSTPRWLRDILPERKKKIAEAVRSAIPGGTVDWKQRFGCGHYGCAYAVKEKGHPFPRYVVKVTRDPTEGPMQATIARRQKAGEYGFDDGFAIVRGVYRVGDDVQHMGKTWPVYAIVREEVKPVSVIQNMSLPYIPGKNDKVGGIYPPVTASQLSLVMSSLNDYKNFAAEWYKLKEGKHPSQRKLDAVEDKMLDALNAIHSFAPTLGQVMQILQSEGTPLRDVHGNNVGVRHHEGIVDPEDPENGLGYIVIFDPGHTPYEGDGKSEIPRVNPGSLETSGKLPATLENGKPFEVTLSDGTVVFVSKDPQSREWRATKFVDGKPRGHFIVGLWEDAVAEVEQRWWTEDLSGAKSSGWSMNPSKKHKIPSSWLGLEEPDFVSSQLDEDKWDKSPTMVSVGALKLGQDGLDTDGEEKIQSMTDALLSGGDLPPIAALFDTKTIIDGHHRFEMAKRLNMKKVPVVWYRGVSPWSKNPGAADFTYSFPDEHLSAAANPAEVEQGFHDAFGIPYEAHLSPVWPKERKRYERKVRGPKELAMYLAAAGDIPQEQFMVALLDQRGGLIGVAIISRGTLNEAAVHPREVFAAAIAARAAGIIGVHNHPSGDVAPSVADVDLSGKLAEVGDIVGIPLYDHLVLGRDGEYSSLASMGMLRGSGKARRNRGAQETDVELNPPKVELTPEEADEEKAKRSRMAACERQRNKIYTQEYRPAGDAVWAKYRNDPNIEVDAIKEEVRRAQAPIQARMDALEAEKRDLEASLPSKRAREAASASRKAAKAAEKSEARKYGEGSCQICEGIQAVDRGGRIVFHGYKRPGVGFTMGRCMGTDHRPFPETDALDGYLLSLRSMQASAEKKLADLPNKTSLSVPKGPKDQFGNRAHVTVDAATATSWDWRSAVQYHERLYREEIKFCEEDIPRVEARIAEGKRRRGAVSANPGVEGFDFADDFGQPADPEPTRGLHLDTLKRGDVVRVGKTKWHVFNAKHGAWVVKYGTSGKKMYQIYSEGDGRFVVQQMSGGGDRIGEPVASGDAEVVGWEERA